MYVKWTTIYPTESLKLTHCRDTIQQWPSHERKGTCFLSSIIHLS